MGNHELNALLYHQPGLNSDGTDDGCTRAHSDKNTAHHQTFLDDLSLGHPDTTGTLDWPLALPLLLDPGDLRLVHACCDDALVTTLLSRRPSGIPEPQILQEIALERRLDTL